MILGLFPLFAQDVNMEIDSTTITEHDEVALRVSIYGAANVKQPEALLDELKDVEGIEIIEEFAWDTINASGDIVLEKKIQLTSRDSGLYWIPGIRVSFVANGKRYAKVTTKIPLKVNPFQVTSQEPRAIRSIKEEPFKFEDIIPLLIVFGIVASLGLGGYLYWKRKKEAEQIVAPEVIIPAHELALSKLKDLAVEKLWQQGMIKEHQSKLTYIVREYLENRFEVQALESTTEEIISDLKSKDISEGHKEQLTKMFRMADMVKFAKAEPPVDIHSKQMEQSEDFIRKTKKVEVIDTEQEKEIS